MASCESRLVGAGFRCGFQDDVALFGMATGPFLKLLKDLSWQSAFYESEKNKNEWFVSIVKTIDIEAKPNAPSSTLFCVCDKKGLFM